MEFSRIPWLQRHGVFEFLRDTQQLSATAFDTSQTSSVVKIDRDRVEEPPIPNRNYLTFVPLSPQVVPANPTLAQQTQTQGSGGFSFAGLQPSNAAYLDRVDDDDEYNGGGRTQISPETISDFQIVNHGFSAESGAGQEGSIDVQTRSELTQRHGDALLFVQNDALNATLPLASHRASPMRALFGRVSHSAAPSSMTRCSIRLPPSRSSLAERTQTTWDQRRCSRSIALSSRSAR